MRTRIALLVVAILLVAGFAALNWSEILRPAPLLFGPVVMDAPMGAILLGLLALATLVFVVAVGTIRTRALLESRQHFRTLEAQRDLADRAEASRFTDLRQYLDVQLRELREREDRRLGEAGRALLEGQRELRAQLEQMNRTLAARLAHLEQRLGTEPDRLHGAGPAEPGGAPRVQPAAPHRPDVHAPERNLQHEHGLAGGRSEASPDATHPVAAERLHQQRLREQNPALPAGDDRPAAQPAGWRRWF